MTQEQLVRIADLTGPPGPPGPPSVYIGPTAPDPQVYTIWIDTSGVEPV